MYRILLVDDDQNIVDGLGSIIKQNFENIFVISSACDGSDALNTSYRRLLSCDHFGYPYAKAGWHQSSGADQQNQIPSVVIMLSGYDDYTYIRNALRLGAYDYLLKPVNIQNFVSMLRLLILRLKDSSVKLQAEEVSCVRPETQGIILIFRQKTLLYKRRSGKRNGTSFSRAFVHGRKEHKR
ncbi:MAG: hypothetical protein ACLSHX_14655 [Suilimivivens sp.]